MTDNPQPEADLPSLCANCEHLAQMHNGVPPIYPCEEPGCTCKGYIAKGPDLPDNHPEAEPPFNKDDYPMVTLEQYRGFVHVSLNADYELAFFEQQNEKLLQIAIIAKTDRERAHRLYHQEFGELNVLHLLNVMIELETLVSTAKTSQIMMQNARTAFEVHNSPSDYLCESNAHHNDLLGIRPVPPAEIMVGTTLLCREHAHAHGFWAPDEKPDDVPDIYGDLPDRLMTRDPYKKPESNGSEPFGFVDDKGGII